MLHFLQYQLIFAHPIQFAFLLLQHSDHLTEIKVNSNVSFLLLSLSIPSIHHQTHQYIPQPINVAYTIHIYVISIQYLIASVLYLSLNLRTIFHLNFLHKPFYCIYYAILVGGRCCWEGEKLLW